MRRRTVLHGSLLGVAGAAAGIGIAEGPGLLDSSRLPLAGGYAPADDRATWVRSAGVSINWFVKTNEPVIAFTFDDGPGPKWTTTVLDVLDDMNLSATFFMVGRNLAEYSELVRGRLNRHEVGNHSWSHPDLARLDAPSVHRELLRAHETIQRVAAHEPKLVRPPYGHLGGSTLLAANDLGYNLVLWSQQSHDSQYEKDPEANVQQLVEHARPGDIVLAHDVGTSERLVTIRHLPQIFAGLSRRGFRFLTVSELLAVGVA